MSDIIITPTVAQRPAIFYDVNHNPLNIPCEGPKVITVKIPIPGSLEPPYDTNFTINFDQIFRTGGISALQSVVIDISGYSLMGSVYPGYKSLSKILTLQDVSSGQTILAYVNGDQQAIGSRPLFSVPLSSTIPPLYTGVVPGVPLQAGYPNPGLNVIFNFYNFIVPQFETVMPYTNYFGPVALTSMVITQGGSPIEVTIDNQPVQVFATSDNPVHTVTP